MTESHLKDLYSAALKYMDSHRDRLNGLMAELTSVRFAWKVEKEPPMHLFSGLRQYAEIRMTSQMVKSDMTTQQHKLTERMISGRKLKEIRTIGTGRGRNLRRTSFLNYQLFRCMFWWLQCQRGWGRSWGVPTSHNRNSLLGNWQCDKHKGSKKNSSFTRS